MMKVNLTQIETINTSSTSSVSSTTNSLDSQYAITSTPGQYNTILTGADNSATVEVWDKNGIQHQFMLPMTLGIQSIAVTDNNFQVNYDGSVIGIVTAK